MVGRRGNRRHHHLGGGFAHAKLPRWTAVHKVGDPSLQEFLHWKEPAGSAASVAVRSMSFFLKAPLSVRLSALLIALVAVVLCVGLPAHGQQLSDKIASKQQREQALEAAVAAESGRISTTEAGLAAAQSRLATIDAAVARLESSQQDASRRIVSARDRLLRLENRMLVSSDALAGNLRSSYMTPEPDVVSVVMSAKGFADLLERVEFAQRVARSDAEILDRARTSRVEVTRTAQGLVRLQARLRVLAQAVERRRDAADAVRLALEREKAVRVARRNGRQAQLATVRDQLSNLREQRAQAASAARRALSQQTTGAETTGTGTAPAPGAAPAGVSLDVGGMAQAPVGAPAVVEQVMAAGNAIAGLPYVYGGGHGSFQAAAYDCSGSVSYALAGAGLVSSPLDSTSFMSWGESGPGKWITVYANAGHAYMVIAGWRFDTSARSGGGTRWTQAMRSNAGFVARHPPGL
jgi:septal ring factor EnvC (AmiA/AmiB activator)